MVACRLDGMRRKDYEEGARSRNSPCRMGLKGSSLQISILALVHLGTSTITLRQDLFGHIGASSSLLRMVLASSAKRGISLTISPAQNVPNAKKRTEDLPTYWKGETTLLSFSMNTRCSAISSIRPFSSSGVVAYRGCWGPGH